MNSQVIPHRSMSLYHIISIHCVVLRSDVLGLQLRTSAGENGETVYNCGSHPVYAMHLVHYMLSYCK